MEVLINLNIQEWIKRELKEQLMFPRYGFFLFFFFPLSRLVSHFLSGDILGFDEEEILAYSSCVELLVLDHV